MSSTGVYYCGSLLVLVSFALGGVYSTQWKEMDDERLYRYIFDEVDMDGIILNDRICNIYLRCFYDEGPCTNLASAMKSKITEVLETVCGHCTAKQKDIWRHALEIFIPRRPDDWQRILKIYDPNGTSWPKVKAFLDSQPK